MCRKFLLSLLVLALSLVSNARAATFYGWTGATSDLWNVAENWNPAEVPPHNSGDVGLSTGVGTLVTIPGGYTADCTFGHESGWGTIFGPEWGTQLDIYGSLTYQWYLAPVQGDSLNPSIINMYDGSSLSGEGIGLGDNWWWWGGPYVTMNMYGDAYADINYMFWGGHLYMYGGTMDIEVGLTLDTIDLISDATRLIDIYGGTLILPADFTDTVNDWISRGILIAYGGAGEIVIDTEVNPGRTTVTAIPEPATIALLGLGGLALLRRRK